MNRTVKNYVTTMTLAVFLYNVTQILIQNVQNLSMIHILDWNQLKTI